MSRKIYCDGCGVLLQDDNVLGLGYTTNLEHKLCRRCFRLKNYGEYVSVTNQNDEYISLLKEINKTRALVLYVVDLINLEPDLLKIKELVQNDMILVFNKKDAFPDSVSDLKILTYYQELREHFVDMVVISSFENYNIDLLLTKIKQHQKTKTVYAIGLTNAGKSSMINTIINHHSTSPKEITISPLPSTTLNNINIKVNEDLTLVDTPGVVDYSNLSNHLEAQMLKKMAVLKEIKPRTYQIKPGQCLVIEDICRIDYVEGEKNSVTLYISNNLNVKRYNAKRSTKLIELNKTNYELKYAEDIVINGLGFIKVVNKGNFVLYLNENINSYQRSNLI